MAITVDHAAVGAILTQAEYEATSGAAHSVSGTVDVADLANGTDGELITWAADATPATVAAGSSGQVLTSNGAGAAPTFQAASSGPTQATQAALEAETNEDTYIPPDLLRFSPGVAKAWGIIYGPGTLQAPDYGISTVGDTGTGNRDVNWTTAFSTAVYSVVVGGAENEGDLAGGLDMGGISPHTLATGDVQLEIHNTAGTNIDYGTCLAAYGDN